LPKVTHERGYLIPAFDTDDVDYVSCAQQLSESIRHHHPDAHVTILTRDQLPFGDQGGYANDWQCFHASPYRQTIKLEADMIAASPVDHWWTLFEQRDVVISQGARDFYDAPAESRTYRRVFDANHLPDVYNAITYWRLSSTAQEFFALIKNIFSNWDHWKQLLKYPEDTASTDVVYAIAATIMGPEQVTLPPGLGPNIVHVKQGIVPTRSRDWTQELIWESDPVRIQTVAQWGFVHYHNKQWRLHNE
jgi:hypothetical protein